MDEVTRRGWRIPEAIYGAVAILALVAGYPRRGSVRRARMVWRGIGVFLFALLAAQLLGAQTTLADDGRKLFHAFGLYDTRKGVQVFLSYGAVAVAGGLAVMLALRAGSLCAGVGVGTVALLLGFLGVRMVSLHDVDGALNSTRLGLSLGTWGEIVLVTILGVSAVGEFVFAKSASKKDPRLGAPGRWIVVGGLVLIALLGAGVSGLIVSSRAGHQAESLAAQPTGGLMLWWEAEDADEHTFGNPWDFRATTPEQQAALSGGEWIQTASGSGVAARWTITVPRAGTYQLWSRKFWKHGPFRYRFGDGEWTHVGRDIEIRDRTTVRPTVEANWVELDLIELTAGKHRFEIIADDGIKAIAFDCWLLDGTGAFEPNGPTRPAVAVDAIPADAAADRISSAPESNLSPAVEPIPPTPIGDARIFFDNPDLLWWEAEDADEENFGNPPAFRASRPEAKAVLSGGNWLQTNQGSSARASWTIQVPEAGLFEFWTRKFWKHGPFRYRWNNGPWVSVGRDIELADSVELWSGVVANWVLLSTVDLEAGANRLDIVGLPQAKAMAFDCWVLSRDAFTPRGKLKPGESFGVRERGWFAWEPWVDADAEKVLDLRFLNQDRAGDDGFVIRDGDHFIFEDSGEPVRFWGVDANAATNDKAGVRHLAKLLASLGVNAVRAHHFIADRTGNDPTAINERYLDQLHYFVYAMADEGIYTDLSFYYPVWMHVKPSDGLAGYKPGDQPFGLLYFDERMQELWRGWARELLTRENPYTGVSLADDPAVAVVEIVNEDSLFFWTFDPARIPPEAIRPLEQAFGKWAADRYGSIEKAMGTWGPAPRPQAPDDVAGSRLGLYSAGFLGGADWAVNQRNTARARDQLEFMARLQRGFYADATKYLRDELGVRCSIMASNWKTADERILGEIERWTYEPAGVIGRNAYFGGPHDGDGSGYSLRRGQTYSNRSGLRGDDAPAAIAFEVSHAGFPQIVTEYNYPMPNAYRAEGPYLAALYGSLHGTDGFFHFALGTNGWDLQHTKFSVATPVTMGQFPALALAYRKGYIKPGGIAYQADVPLEDLFSFHGTKIWQSPNLDAFRAADVAAGAQQESPEPAALLAGSVVINVVDDGEVPVGNEADAKAPSAREQPLANAAAGEVQPGVFISNTHEIIWDTNRGVVLVNTPFAQGVCGFLADTGAQSTSDFVFDIKNDYAAAIIVSLDGKPLSECERALLQVVTRDRNAGWGETLGEKKEIKTIGSPPVMVQRVKGTVSVRQGEMRALPLTAAGSIRNGPEPPSSPSVQLGMTTVWYQLNFNR